MWFDTLSCCQDCRFHETDTYNIVFIKSSNTESDIQRHIRFAHLQLPHAAAWSRHRFAADCSHSLTRCVESPPWDGLPAFLTQKTKLKNKMKPTNPNADTYVEEQRQYLFITYSNEPTCGTPWLDALRWHSCRTPLLDTIAQRSGKTFLLDTLVGHSCVTILLGHSYLTLL